MERMQFVLLSIKCMEKFDKPVSQGWEAKAWLSVLGSVRKKLFELVCRKVPWQVDWYWWSQGLAVELIDGQSLFAFLRRSQVPVAIVYFHSARLGLQLKCEELCWTGVRKTTVTECLYI